MNGINLQMKNVSAKLDNGDRSDDVKSELLFMVFVCKYGVLNRIEEHSIPMRGGINIPSFGLRNVPFQEAYSQTVGKVLTYAENIGLEAEAEDILNGGKLYQMFLSKLPSNQLKNI